MAAFSRTEEFMSGRCAVTRAEYDEFGGERVKRWWGGNWNGEFGVGASRDEKEPHKMDVDV
jgi:actin-related protein 5